jgi:ribosome-associated protein
MQLEALQKMTIDALEELKAQDLKILDVRGVATFTDLMIIASGGSTRQVKALADKVIEKSTLAGVRPLGVEGQQEAEWILVDLGDIVVHVMLPQTRDFYNLEKLWSMHSRPGVQRAGSGNAYPAA